jgi:hypothetical protein
MSSCCTRAVIAVALLGLSMTAPVVASVASAEPLLLAQTEKADKKVKPKKEKRECRRVRNTGSRIASRECKKPSEWARISEASQDAVRNSVEGTKRNTGSVTSE